MWVPPAYRIECRSYRPATEDRAAVFDHRDGIVVVVCDGVGGRYNGGVAADAALSSVGRQVPGLTDLHSGDTWLDVLRTADADVRAAAGGGETTVVVVAVTADGQAGAAVGDSEAWLVSPAGVDVLCRRTRTKPYLGFGIAVAMPFERRRRAGTLVVGTDGLFKYAGQEQIVAAALDPDLAVAAERIVDLPRPPGGPYPDDVAVVVCR